MVRIWVSARRGRRGRPGRPGRWGPGWWGPEGWGGPSAPQLNEKTSRDRKKRQWGGGGKKGAKFWAVRPRVVQGTGCPGEEVGSNPDAHLSLEMRLAHVASSKEGHRKEDYKAERCSQSWWTQY